MTRQAGTSRPVSRRIRWRLSASHLFIGFAVALAFTLNYLALQDRGDTQWVAVADRELLAGNPLSVSDIRLVPVASDFEPIDSLISEPSLPAYEGWILSHGVDAGDLIVLSSLVAPGAPDGFRSMSIPVPVEHAAGGTLSAGDRVDVITVEDGVSTYVVADVEVIRVADREGGALGSLGQYHLVVSVDADQALALASAIDSGSLEVLRSTGAPAIPLFGNGS